jgi:hypothetical protein
MSTFEIIDDAGLALRIGEGRERVLLCAPGFGDPVSTALIEAHGRLGRERVVVIVDGTAQAARLGYGHFDAVGQLSQAGVAIRVEPGLRLGTLIVDGQGWCFATPPLLVDATMEKAIAPNAMCLMPAQVEALVSAISPPTQPFKEGQLDSAVQPEIGAVTAKPEALASVQAALQADPPQQFDIARKVNVFNAFVEFVELSLVGTELTRQRVALPRDLLLAVSDRDTRERLTTSFQLIDPGATIGREAKEIRQAVDKLRKVHTRVLNPYGSITLRSNRQRLEAAVAAVQVQVAAFAGTVKNRLQKEIDHSRKQLVQSVLPGLKAKPPEALLAGVVGKPTVEQITRWIDRQLDQAFPKVDDIVSEMRLVLTIKAVTFEMLKEPKFQAGVREAYPDVDFDKPFSEFTAARSTLQPSLEGLGR